MPVRVAEQVGVTRDVSVDGIYFELDKHLQVGSEINFEVEIHSPLGNTTLKCDGQVVRTELKDGRTGIAVRMLAPRLQKTA